MLTIRNYQKSYGQRLILTVEEANFDEGTHWVKGENGSGKTTLLMSLAGIIPFEGEVTFNSINLRQHQVKFRECVSVSEAKPEFPGFLKGTDLLRFISSIRNADKKQQAHLVEAFDAGSFLQDPVYSYSSGMLKKLSIILAFLGSTPLIILDEPLATLDEKSQQHLAALIEERSKQQEMTFILSSHQNLPERIRPASVHAVVNHMLTKE